MSIQIIKRCLVTMVMFFSCASLAQANVVINEIQLSPTEERFIELYNSGSSSVDLTGWSIKKKTSSGLEYPLVATNRTQGKIISADSYLLLANEGNYTGSITPDITWASSYNLAINNALVLYNDDEVVFRVGWGEANAGDCGGTCAPNPSDGQSVQKTSNGDWVIDSPTPRAQNVESGGNNTGGEEEENTDEGGSGNSDYDKEKLEPLKVTTKIIAPKLVTADIPFLVSSLTTTNKGETYAIGNFTWNFGDGMTKKTSDSSSFEYLYEYPGEYVLKLSYLDKSSDVNMNASDKIIIKVIPSEIYISSIGTNSDPFIEIENKSNYEIILSNWIVTAGAHNFTVPEGTTLLPNKKIKLSPKITGFTGEDIKFVVITDPNREIIATYPTSVKKTVQKKSSGVNTANANQVLPDNNLQNDALMKDPEIINLNDMGASVEKSGINIPNSIYPLVGLLVIIGVGVTSFLLIKKRNNGVDYIEKELRAEDMTIIE